tara:strand:+ start:110 stop:1786 length:1677 start_codon:yes stop_codon:yes gene_type:complete
MKVSFFLKSRPLKDGRKNVGLQFTFARDLQEQKLTGIKVYPELWDKSEARVNKEHIGYEEINRALAEYKHRIEVANIKYETGRIGTEQVIAEVLKKSDISSVEKYISTAIANDLDNDHTVLTYMNWWKGHKKMIGKTGKSININDLLVENYYVRAWKKGNELVRTGKLSSRSYSNYITICQKVLNHAKDNNYIFDEYVIKKKYRTTDVYRLTREKKIIEPSDVYKAINQVKTIEQWNSVAIWLLSFSMRGFYYSDIVAMSEEVLKNKNDKPSKRHLFGDMYLDTMRAKSSIHIFTNIPRPVLRLLHMIKFTFVYKYIHKELNGKSILAHINDRVGVVDYSVAKNGKFHNSFWKHFQKKSRKFGLDMLNSRKTFNHYGQRIKVDKETREILLGHLGKRTIDHHYNHYKLPEVIKSVDEAHFAVLEAFKTTELIQLLTNKLRELIEAKNLPKWMLIQSGVHKVGREYKVLVGMREIDRSKGKDWNRPEWATIETKYKKYFKADLSQDKGYWIDEDTWLDEKNRIKKAFKKNLIENKWFEEAKRQEKEVQEAKVISIKNAV